MYIHNPHPPDPHASASAIGIEFYTSGSFFFFVVVVCFCSQTSHSIYSNGSRYNNNNNRFVVRIALLLLLLLLYVKRSVLLKCLCIISFGAWCVRASVCVCVCGYSGRSHISSAFWLSCSWLTLRSSGLAAHQQTLNTNKLQFIFRGFCSISRVSAQPWTEIKIYLHNNDGESNFHAFLVVNAEFILYFSILRCVPGAKQKNSSENSMKNLRALSAHAGGRAHIRYMIFIAVPVIKSRSPAPSMRSLMEISAWISLRCSLAYPPQHTLHANMVPMWVGVNAKHLLSFCWICCTGLNAMSLLPSAALRKY